MIMEFIRILVLVFVILFFVVYYLAKAVRKISSKHKNTLLLSLILITLLKKLK